MCGDHPSTRVEDALYPVETKILLHQVPSDERDEETETYVDRFGAEIRLRKSEREFFYGSSASEADDEEEEDAEQSADGFSEDEETMDVTVRDQCIQGDGRPDA